MKTQQNVFVFRDFIAQAERTNVVQQSCDSSSNISIVRMVEKTKLAAVIRILEKGEEFGEELQEPRGQKLDSDKLFPVM